MAGLQAQETGSLLDFQLEGVELQSETANLSDLLAPSSAQLNIPGLRSIGPLAFNVRDISTNSRLQGSPSGAEQIDIYQRLSIASIESELPISSLTWTSEIKEIQNELIRSYYDLLAQLQDEVAVSGATLNPRINELGQELALLLVQHSLVFNNLVEANAYGGAHSVDLAISWGGLADLTNMAALDRRAVLSALNIQLLVSLDLEAILRSQAGNLIDPFVQQGYIHIDNGRILVTGSLLNGELTVNGEVIPIEQFL
jgi:hypothetical protein